MWWGSPYRHLLTIIVFMSMNFTGLCIVKIFCLVDWRMFLGYFQVKVCFSGWHFREIGGSILGFSNVLTCRLSVALNLVKWSERSISFHYFLLYLNLLHKWKIHGSSDYYRFELWTSVILSISRVVHFALQLF